MWLDSELIPPWKNQLRQEVEYGYIVVIIFVDKQSDYLTNIFFIVHY